MLMDKEFNTTNLTDEYLKHNVFKELEGYATFYKLLSFSTFGAITMGISGSAYSTDSYFYSAVQGTIQSMQEILLKGRISDVYTLLRKYHDAVVINIYTTLYLDENRSIDNFVVEKIDNWIKGKEQLPEFRIMSQYIANSEKVAKIKELLDSDTRYKDLRDRCNDHTHYNFYYNAVINDGEIYIENRVKKLDQFAADLRDVFIQHFALLFTAKEYYMSSSDYVDSLDMGIEPEDGSQYNVATFIQGAFSNLVQKYRPDIAKELKSSTHMRLE